MSVEEVTAALESARVSASGVSFAGSSLRLNTEEDVKLIIEEIDNCSDLLFLNLEGNTLGVEASQAIAKSLEKHPELKRALWKDLFTGRLKTEIPKALEFLGKGLVTAGARLLELDLSDNAFGPIGVEGLASLLRSSSCYALEELRLNNNGLGITGGKLLAKALLDCYEYSNKQGKAVALKVFIAGRNRLENEGAKALAEVFKTIGTLEEIAMPQNGIYHDGISALSDAFKHNTNLQILNLNDNTIGPEGAKAIADVLPILHKLREINFGDCLLKTKGAQHLAVGLQSCTKLEQLSLGFNEIRFDGAKALISAISNKSKLKVLVLDGNELGSQGRTNIKNLLKEIGKLNVLGSLDEDVSGDSDSEDSSNTSSSSDEDVTVHVKIGAPKEAENNKIVFAEDFLAAPSSENFLKLGNERTKLLLASAVSKNNDSHLDKLVKIVMKVSALTVSKDLEISSLSMKSSEQLYQELYTWAQKTDNISITNNSILVHLGLIKSEDKKFKPSWNLHGCLLALGNALKKNYIPESTKSTLKLFLEK